MIYLYSGTPGSGKSYHATKDIYEMLVWLKKPHAVIANFDLPGLPESAKQNFHYVPNEQLSCDFLVRFADEWWSEPEHHFKEDSILLVVDEAQLWLNSRTWQDSQRMDLLEFASQHRHHGYKIILVAQSDKMIDRQFRALIEYEVHHRKVANFGIGGKILGLFAAGRLHVCVSRYYGLSERLGADWFIVRRKYTRLYDSYNHFKRQRPVRAVASPPLSPDELERAASYFKAV